MNNNFNLSPDQLDQLLGVAGQKLGTDPQQLKSQLQSGALDGVMNRIPPEKAQEINALLQDPQALEQFLSSPKVKMMLAALLGKGGK